MVEKQEEHSNGFSKKKKSKWTIFLRFLLLLILLPFFLSLCLQIPYIQKATINYFTKGIEQKIDREIEIKHAYLNIFKGLRLESIYIQGDSPKDTLASFDKIYVSLSQNLFSLFKGTLSLNAIEIDGSKIHIIKEKNEKKNNVSLILESLKNKNKDKVKEKRDNGNGLVIDLNEVSLKNIEYVISDLNTDSRTIFNIVSANVLIDSINLKTGYIDVKSFVTKSPTISIILGTEETTITADLPDTSNNPVDSVVNDIKNNESIIIQKLIIEDGIFNFQDKKSTAIDYPNAIDLKNFTLSKINLDAENVYYLSDEVTSFDLKTLSLIDKKDFTLNNLSSDDIKITSTFIEIPSLYLKTKDSELNSNFSIRYNDFGDFGDFEDKVILKTEFGNSRVALKDLIHFIPVLNKSPFFSYNQHKVVSLRGKLQGDVNDLSGTNISLKIANKLDFNGDFSSINLTDAENALINLNVKSLKTSVSFLQEFIPEFSPPETYFKLGDINFTGKFDGYFKDFIANGTLDSELGTAILDMRLDVKEGNEKARYNGKMRLIDFDLGNWSDRNDVGKVTFYAQVKDGKGLTLSSAYADLDAVIESIVFKDYVYENLELNGILEENKFNGEFNVSDDNIDLKFNGYVSYIDSILNLDIEANIRNLDLQQLNLTTEKRKISGHLTANVSGSGFVDLVGVARGEDIVIEADTIHELDHFSLYSYSILGGRSKMELSSDLGRAKIEGVYQLKEVLPMVKSMIKKNYPYHTKEWEVNNSSFSNNNFKVELEIEDTKRMLELIGLNKFRIKKLRSKGIVDSDLENFNFDTNIGFVNYKGNEFFDSELIFGNKSDKGFLVINVDSSKIAGKSYNPLFLESDLNADSLNFSFATEKLIDSVEIINFKGSLSPHPKGYKFTLEDKELSMLGSQWKIFSENEVVIGKNFIGVNDLILSDGNREIELQDINKKGLSIKLKRFNFLTINGIIDYDKIDFSGEGEVQVSIDNILGGENYIQARMFIEDFRLNEERYGTMDINLDKAKDDSYKVLMSLAKGDQTVKATIDYDSKTNVIGGLVRGRAFPLDIFEFIIGDGISETVGTGDVDGVVSGTLDDIKIEGEALMKACGLRLEYLGTSFFMDQQKIKITENYIDLSDVILLDAEGDEGVMSGGLRHDLFSDFRMELKMSSDNALIIDTDKSENPLYYGYGKGKVDVSFSGTFEGANIDVVAITGPGTVLNIPVEYTETGYEESFITFVDKQELLKPKKRDPNEEFKIEGLNVTMTLTLTDDAGVNIIFNERLGDIIQGKGRGDLQIYVKRTGEFEVYGDYEVSEGEYLFTAWNVAAKPFQVRRGGKIKWSGDPINAALDIKADYAVRSPLDIFLQEFLIPNTDSDREASNAQNINLILDLGGTLFSPQVKFDLEFPNLVGELNSFAQSKLRTLRTNEIALNSQVLGLLVFNSFLPNNNPLNGNVFGGNQVFQAGISTISEFVSSQLSQLLTGLLQEALSENGLIAGIDFEIGLRNNSAVLNGDGSAINSDYYPDEITLNLRNRFRFLDERLSLGAGLNYVRESPLQGVTDYYIPNIVLEYYLTDDRRLKLRLYGRRDIDERSLNARRDRLGLGIGYRKEFGSLSEAFTDIKNTAKAIKTQDGGN